MPAMCIRCCRRLGRQRPEHGLAAGAATGARRTSVHQRPKVRWKTRGDADLKSLASVS